MFSRSDTCTRKQSDKYHMIVNVLGSHYELHVHIYNKEQTDKKGIYFFLGPLHNSPILRFVVCLCQK